MSTFTAPASTDPNAESTDAAAADPKPAEDIRFVRASVANQCNLNCVYCPKASGMENQVPPALAGQRLSPEDYCANLDHLAASGVIRGISFTGGEPTLNAALPDLIAYARTRFDRVELTTNGRRLPEMINRLAAHLDVIKVSLDAVDRDLSHQIMRGHRDDHDRALTAIRLALAAGMTVGVNVVVMRRNLHQLEQVLDAARRLRAEAGAGTLYVSLLDLYYSDETRDLWISEFVPLDSLAGQLRDLLGDGVEQDRGGCAIDWFDAGDGVQIRVKSSYESTYRSARCQRCPVYCQEGLYGLKHSVEGWVTPCPTGDPGFGVHLSPGLPAKEAAARLAPWMRELVSTTRVEDSFATFLARRRLPDPAATDHGTSAVVPYSRRALPLLPVGSASPGCGDHG